MKISELLNGGVTVSCELFPPKHGTELTAAKTVVRDTAALSPSFISVTCSVGGSIDRTVSLADEAQNVRGVTALAHLTCLNSEREDARRVLAALQARGIQNILALRGDDMPDKPLSSGRPYRHACELMEEITDWGGFCVGGACYPEGHPESPTLQADIDSLKTKAACGCAFLITQMFFDNNILYNYLFRLLKSGVDIPVIAGIMPVTDGRQIARICKLSGTALPPRFKAIVDKFSGSPAAMKQAGVAYATEQIIDLIANGVHNIHIYTMNKPDIAGLIMGNLSEIFK